MYRILAAQRRGPRAARPAPPPGHARPELLATGPNELWSLGHHQAAGSGQVDLLLPVRDPRRLQPLRARLDGRQPRERRARRAPHRRHRAPSRTSSPGQLTVHADRGSSMTQQAGRAPARRPRHRQEPQPAPRVQRQPLLRGPVQDAQVPARLPRPLRLASRTPAPSARSFFAWYNTEHRHSGIGLLTPADVHLDGHAEIHAGPRGHPRRRLRRPPRALRPPAADAARSAHRRLDQPAGERRCHLSNPRAVSHRA